MRTAKTLSVALLLLLLCQFSKGQNTVGHGKPALARPDTSSVQYIYDIGNIAADSAPTINVGDVTVVYFKTADEWMQYYKYKSRIQKVLPYVKIAKQIYLELEDKEDNTRKGEYRHYRKDLEKEMRTKFEKELKDLTTTQGEMLFKLINRETGNNCYRMIKDVKGPFAAWFYQIVAKKWGYDLKQNYDPQKEKMIELIIKQMGKEYNV